MSFAPRRSATWTTGPDRAMSIARRLEQASLMLSKRLDLLNLAAGKEAWALAREARKLAGAISSWQQKGETPDRETWSSLRGRLMALETASDAFFARPDIPDVVRLAQ